MHVAAIIAAGGLGTRMGGLRPKQFLDLGDGSVMLQRSIEAIVSCASVNEIVVALPPGISFAWDESRAPATPVKFVAGGARRQDSVRAALAGVSTDADLIVIHDAARPFATADLFERTIRAAHAHGAAIAAIPVTDTVKQTRDASGHRLITSTLPRETIYLAQTPQAFRRDVLTTAFAGDGDAIATDEATLVERAGFSVYVVEGDAGNIKVTTPQDLSAAREQVRQQGSHPQPLAWRVGTGYDLHRLVPDRPLILAGVRIPFERGLEGHSDADIVCHAIIDAVLGASALGDIGQLFPDTHPEWEDADSLQLLERAMALVKAAGYVVANVDATVIAERPKLLPFVAEMRGNLARVLGVSLDAVSVKGKTNERVDATGRGDAMACHAVALLMKQ